MDKLAVGKTERSEMGEVRALWRNHLKLDTDEELFAILDTFHIMEGYHSLQDMRENVEAFAALPPFVRPETSGPTSISLW
jgi:hypothetical protein